MSPVVRIKGLVRALRDVSLLLVDSVYDFYRYVRFSGMFRRRDPKTRQYKTIKIYHALEKSLAFREVKPDSGWSTARTLSGYLGSDRARELAAEIHERAAIKALSDFSKARGTRPEKDPELAEFLSRNIDYVSEHGGALDYSRERLADGLLSDPERFFNSRYSVRDFAPATVDPELIQRALRLASKTPSACNRQEWHVYHIDERTMIDRALECQSGNRGFGHEVPCLLIITTDIRAFEAAIERNQPYIDGGMYAMSIVAALHSLGVGSCCLNWSQGVRGDLLLRRRVPISPHHVVIMMLAVGYPNTEFKVCSSVRTPLSDGYTYLHSVEGGRKP